MPALQKSGGPSLFLGIELGVDQLRASIVDDTLELVGVECVDFDSELPEYKLRLLLSASARKHRLTRSTPISLEPRGAYSPHPARHTRPQLRCGSKASVSPPFFPLFSPFFPHGTNFFFLFGKPFDHARFLLDMATPLCSRSLTRPRDPDTIFEKLHRNYDLTKIKAIGGAAQVMRTRK